MQQAHQWHGQMQQNAPSQFYAQNMAMTQQHPMQNAEGQAMNFQHFQVYYLFITINASYMSDRKILQDHIL